MTQQWLIMFGKTFLDSSQKITLWVNEVVSDCFDTDYL